MVDFRKSFLLAAMALAIGVGTASAQTVPNCAATTGAPPTLRQGGVEELTGAFQLVCTNIVATTTVNFDVTLNSPTLPITSRVGEAMVTVTGEAGFVPGVVVNTGLGATTANDVRFSGVTVPGGSSTITFTGIRTDAHLVNTSAGFGQVVALLSVSNGVLPVTEPGSGLIVGIVLPGLGPISVSGSAGIQNCGGITNLGAGVNFTVNIPELFPTAFKQQSAGPNVDSETGPAAGAIPATSGTQFAVNFSNIPSGVTFYVPVTITSFIVGTSTPAGGVANLVVSEGSTVLNGGALLTGTGVPPGYYVAVTAGTVLYYNVTTSQPSLTENYEIPIYNSASSLSSTTLTTGVTVSLAPGVGDFPLAGEAAPYLVPVSGAFVPVPNTGLVPRFIPSNAPAASFSTTPNGCQTSLLFPFVSNQAGFDTGISIAATGTDPFGTNVGGGTCTIYMYGVNPPATFPTLTIPNGAEFHTTVSAVAPNFQGYAIAVCPFTFAHGYAFISDGFMGGGRGLSEGYVAKVIDYRSGASTLVQQVPITNTNGNLSIPKPESLGN